jgi:hypothetical protein
MAESVAPVVVYWEETLREVLARTAKFPKSIRFTLSSRIDGLALDIYEGLIEARYSREKAEHLRRANLNLEKMRLLLRLSCDMGHLDRRGFEFLIARLLKAGRMVGGWRKERSGQ